MGAPPITVIKMGIGQIIKAKREARGWSQRELARYTQDKITQAAISKIESGQDSIRMDTLRLIARALNCATVDLLPEEDKRIAA
jgi:transcriptional regulator with XRE-family HTH domain